MLIYFELWLCNLIALWLLSDCMGDAWVVKSWFDERLTTFITHSFFLHCLVLCGPNTMCGDHCQADKDQSYCPERERRDCTTPCCSWGKCRGLVLSFELRERQTERERDRYRYTEIETQRQRWRHRDRDRETESILFAVYFFLRSSYHECVHHRLIMKSISV